MTEKNKKIILTEEEVNEKAILRQVHEEVRKEKFYTFILRYKKLIIITVLVMIIGAIGVFANANYQENKSKKYSKLMHQFLVYADAHQNVDALKTLEYVTNDKAAPPDLKALAIIKYASILVEQNQFLEAAELLLKVNNDKRVDIYLKEFAGLLALKTMVDSDDQKFVAKIEGLLSKLEQENVIIKSPVVEQKAIFYWFQNKPLTARKIFETLALNPESSVDLKKRAREFISIIDNKK